MNVEELAKERDNLFPKEIAGYKRPDTFLDKSNDFFDELPQFIQKDPVYFKILNYIFSVLISNDVRVKSWVDSLSSDMNEQDFRVVTELVKGVMTPEMLKKLNGIEVGAQVNKNAFGKIQVNGKIYNAMILQDAIELIEGNNVTLSIDTATGAVTLNAKDTTYAIVSTTADGLVPKRDGSANKYLCADGTWKQVTQYIHPDSGVTAGTYKSVTVNAQGHVTAGSNPTTLAGYGITDAAPLNHGIHVPSGGSDGTFLRGDLTWQAISGLGGIVAYSLNQNGYIKFGCGLILQWGINNAGNNGNEGESGWYAFPINFNSACFALFCGLRNTDTNNPTKYDSEVQPRNWTTSKFNVYKQDYGGDPWFGSFIWFAIGR
ncbi:MAG TPA: hypothetical protein OIL90_01395 [Phascolarctobacterium faecium]|nr:hypothetical protein [Phascolarctobacterium faecium]HJI08774.1 hypothetical protein [Phascolarctobacterium faecium]